jgi:hypothetical protein
MSRCESVVGSGKAAKRGTLVPAATPSASRSPFSSNSAAKDADREPSRLLLCAMMRCSQAVLTWATRTPARAPAPSSTGAEKYRKPWRGPVKYTGET